MLSPVEKFKEISQNLGRFKNNMEFMQAYFAGANDPTATDTVFKMQRALMSNLGAEERQEVTAMLRQNPLSAQMMAEKYLAKPYTTDDLAGYAPGSLGYAYYRHLHDNGFDPNFVPVQEVVDDFSYFVRRLGQLHDIWHVVTGYGVDVPGEIGLQAFTTTLVPETLLSTSIISGGLLYSVMHNSSLSIPVLDAISVGWQNGKAARPLLAVQWEEQWERSLDELRREYNIIPVSTLYDYKPELVQV